MTKITAEPHQVVYTANKDSYGAGFFNVCDTLDELKRAIVEQEMYFNRDNIEYTDDMYTEELFEECKGKGEYHLHRVKLHPDEQIEFDEYDGKSGFYIQKKIPPKILSRYEYIED